MKKCLWDTIIIIELWFLQFSTKKQANKQSSVIHRFILHAALLGYLKLAHTDDQHFLFPLKKINRGMDRDGSRLLAHRLSTTDLREWKPALDLSASVIDTRASHFAGTKIWNSCQCQCHDEHFREKTCQGKPHELQSFSLMLAVYCDREYWKESAWCYLIKFKAQRLNCFALVLLGIISLYMLSQTLPLSSLQKRTVFSNDSTIYGLLKKENEISYPASWSKRSFSNYDVKMW